ncbi:hypothetical protein SRHO_G00060140 [Serrasalmus rhombeus]
MHSLSFVLVGSLHRPERAVQINSRHTQLKLVINALSKRVVLCEQRLDKSRNPVRKLKLPTVVPILEDPVHSHSFLLSLCFLFSLHNHWKTHP